MPSLDRNFLLLVFWKYIRSLVDAYYRESKLWGEFWDNPDQDISWNRFKEILKYMYSNEEINPRYVGMPRRLTMLYEWLCILELHRLAKYLPASAKVNPIGATSRINYEAEHNLYRTSRRFIEEFSTIDRRYYEQYVLIAKKYNWDYEILDEVYEY